MMIRRLLSLTLLALLPLIMIGCGGGAEEDGGTLTIGATPVPQAEILTFIRDNLAEEKGLTLEIVEFTDYVQPNMALNDGELDANFFQHVPYMEEFSESRGIEMVAVTPVHIEPLGIYSTEIDSVKDTYPEATVAIPNDPTNAGRALNLLAEHQLIRLHPDAGMEATVQDIVDNPLELEIVELEAAQLPRALEDVTLAVINGNYALEADLKPAEDAIALESGEGNPYANVLAVLPENEDDPRIQALAELLNSPEVKAFIEERYAGGVLPAFPAAQ